MSELSTERSWRAGWLDDAYWQAVRTELYRDRLIYALVLAHVIGALVLALALGASHKLVYLTYVPIWLRALALVALLYITVFELPASIRANPSSPLARLTTRLPDIFNPRLAAAGVLVLAVVLLQGSFTSVKNLLSDMTPFHWDASLAAADAWIHGGRDPWRWLQPLLGRPAVTRAIQMAYVGGWVIALCTVPALLGGSRRLDHLRQRFFLTYLFVWVVLGNIMAGIFMSAGPVYYGDVTGDVARFADQLAYLSFSEGLTHSSYDLQRMLWALHDQGRTEMGSGISAFPSVHVAMATLFALTGWAINRWAGIAATIFLAVIMAGSVHLAWHYAIDGYVSMIAVAAVWFGIAAWQRRRRASPAWRLRPGGSAADQPFQRVLG